jgi:hypothetical protein
MMMFRSRHLFAVLSRRASLTVRSINIKPFRVQSCIWFDELREPNAEGQSTEQSSLVSSGDCETTDLYFPASVSLSIISGGGFRSAGCEEHGSEHFSEPIKKL